MYRVYIYEKDEHGIACAAPVVVGVVISKRQAEIVLEAFHAAGYLGEVYYESLPKRVEFKG